MCSVKRSRPVCSISGGAESSPDFHASITRVRATTGSALRSFPVDALLIADAVDDDGPGPVLLRPVSSGGSAPAVGVRDEISRGSRGVTTTAGRCHYVSIGILHDVEPRARDAKSVGVSVEEGMLLHERRISGDRSTAPGSSSPCEPASFSYSLADAMMERLAVVAIVHRGHPTSAWCRGRPPFMMR